MAESVTRQLQEPLMKAIEAANMAQAESILILAAERSSYHEALTDLLEPTLTTIGEKWTQGQSMVLAQGYLAAKLAEKLLVKMLGEKTVPTLQGQPYGPVVIGNIEDDFHALGRRMVFLFLQSAGWEVIDLGNDVPATEFVRVAKERNARVIGVSAMMFTTAMNIRKLRDEIDKAGLKGKVQLAVGGAVFLLRPELTQEVGGDGTSKNALLAPELFERLAMASMNCEMGR